MGELLGGITAVFLFSLIFRRFIKNLYASILITSIVCTLVYAIVTGSFSSAYFIGFIVVSIIEYLFGKKIEKRNA